MITALTSEATTWLGYLQRGSVLIQVGLLVAAISSESRVKRKLSSPLIASLTHLIVPTALFISASVLTLAGITAGFLQYLALMKSAVGTIRWVRLAIRGLLSLRLTRDSLLRAATNKPIWMSTEPRCR